MLSDDGPDKGYAWVIAFAACIINMILSGLSRMIGILYVGVIKEYGVSRQEATAPFTVRNSVRCLSGPLVGLIGQHIGIRKVTLIGGVIASVGACLCAVAPNVVWLTVFWGGIHGFGFAFANTLFQVVVNQYFKKYRVTASGIALSGACVGSLGFPFLVEAILDTYSLPGGFLILGGIIMHVLPPALLLRSPPWADGKNRKDQPTPKEATVTAEEPDLPLAQEVEGVTRCEIYRTTSLSNCPLDGIELRKDKKHSAPGSPSSGSERSINVRPSAQCSKACSSVKEEQAEEVSHETTEKNGPEIVIQNGSSNCSCPDNKGGAVLQRTDSVKKYGIILSSLLSIVRLYKNPVYVLICIGMAIYVLIFIPILTVIVDYSHDKGIGQSEGKYLINAMALGDLIGRLCFGWVTDRGYMTIPKFFTTTLILQGVFVSLFPLTTNLVSLMVVLGLYGVMAGSMLILFPVLVLKYVSVEQQAVGMGNVGFMSGMVSFGLPPLIGHFRDNIGSYDGMFYLIGGASFASGALWFLEPVLAKRLEESNEQKQTRKTANNESFQPKPETEENKCKVPA